MQNRSRFIIFLVIASLLAGLIAFPAAAAAGTGDIVYFTAVNNKLLELNTGTMPAKIKSQIYVPCSVFNSGELGTRAQYFPDLKLAVVTDGSIKLYFSLETNETYDSDGKYYDFKAIYINKTAYLPVYYVIKYVFKYINYSYQRYDDDGFHLIRLTNGDVFSDLEFVGAAYPNILAQLSQYYKSIATPVPSSIVTAAPTPSNTYTPTPKPSSGGLPSQEDRSGVTVYLAFLGIGEKTADLLDRLDRRDYKACFFATAEQIRAFPGIARRIYGTGHTLGILLSGDSPMEDYKEASKALLSAVRTAVLITAAEGKLTDEQLKELNKSGLIVWSAEKAEDYTQYIYTKLEKAQKRCDLIFNGAEPPGKANMQKLLDTLEHYNYTVGNISELTETRLEDVT